MPNQSAPLATARRRANMGVICLPGLTRNSRDFNVLPTYLSKHADTPRNVYCFDYRGAQPLAI